MFKLILVYGVWINPYQISDISQYMICDHEETNSQYMTVITMASGDEYKFKFKTCKEVAQEINKQMEG